jgi:hypothetical protein
MSQDWLKKYLRMRPEVDFLFNELDEYLEFCKRQGYVYDESHLGNEKTPWGEWQRVKAGKIPKNNWSPYPKEPRKEWKPRDRNTNWKYRA